MTYPGDPTPMTPAQTGALRTSLDALTAESQAMRNHLTTAEANRDRETRRRRRDDAITRGLLGALTALLLLTMLTMWWQHHKIREDTRRATEQAQDCYRASGTCYQREHQRQLYIAECAQQFTPGPLYNQQFEACVMNRETAAATPTPSPAAPPVTGRPTPTPATQTPSASPLPSAPVTASPGTATP